MSEEIQVVQVGAAGAALAQASAALALQYKDETATLKGQVDTAKTAVDVAKAAVDTAKGQVDTAKTAVDVAKAAVDLSQADVIARQAIVVAAQATTEAARDVAVEQASEAAEKAAEAAGNASLALAIFGTADNLNAAQQIMLGYATTAQAQAGLAASSAASASSVAQQDLSGVTAAKLHSSPNAVTAMCLYDVSKDSDGGAWVERVTNTSWFQEALNGTYLPGGFASEMDARDYLGSYQAASIVTGDSSTFSASIGSWVATANVTVTAVNGRLRLTLTGSLGTVGAASLAIPTTVGQRYQIALLFATAQAAGQNQFLNAGTTAGGTQLANLTLSTTQAGSVRYLSFVATGTTSYINLSSASTWATGTFAEIDSVTVKPVTLADPAGAFYQLNTDGKFYRPWKNLFANSGFTGGTSGTWGSGAVAPTGWQGTVGNGSFTIQTSTTPTRPGNSIRYQATAQRPQIYQIVALPTYVSAVFSVYVETLTSGTPQIRDIALPSPVPSGSTVTYRKNGSAAVSTDTVTTGDYIEAIVSTAGTAGNCYFQHGLGCTANITADITLSPPQVEYVATAATPATAYEEKAAGVGSQSEVFRGNKAKFPRLSAIVAEAGSVTIYDLTEPGRPMWMRFAGLGGGTSAFRGSAASVMASQGQIILGHNLGVSAAEFAGDRAFSWSSGGRLRYRGPLSRRNDALGQDTDSATAVLPSNTVNAVSMCVMPDAPVDPVTGLQVPTIACATQGGVSIVQNDGTVRNSSSGSSFGYISINKDVLVAGSSSSSTIQYALKPGSLGASFGTTSITANTAPGFNDAAAIPQAIGVGRGMVVDRVGARVAMMRLNETTPSQSLAAWIGATYNTGWWCGDIRRVWMADTVAGVIGVGSEAVTTVDFTAGWTDVGTPTKATTSITVAAAGGAYKSGLLTVGRSYQFVLDVTVTGGSIFGLQNSQGASSPTLLPGGLANGTGVYTGSFVASDTALYFRLSGAGSVVVNSIAIRETAADRSYKAKHLTTVGTLTRTAVAAAAQLVAYSGFSGSNYIQESYSADLDFGTGAWTCSAWVTIPTTLPASSFPELTGEIWNDGAATFGGASSRVSPNVYRIYTPDATLSFVQMTSALTLGRVYKVGLTVDSITVLGAGIRVRDNGTVYNSLGAKQGFVEATVSTTMFVKREGGATDIQISGLSVKEVGPAVIAQRAHSSGPSIALGVDALGRLTATAFDGTTTRTVTTTASYNTGQRIKARASYTTDGTLSISVNGRPVASTYGTPLLTMNNASAVTTIGNSRTLDAPFPGDICLVKWGATVPTAEQILWMYEQEKQMFRAGAQVTLPDTGNLVDVSYDDLTDMVTTVSAANEAHFNGLVRTSTAAVPAGAFTKAARGSGVKLLARSTTNPGVDVSFAAQNLREQLLRADDAARRARLPATFDYVGGFTANVTNGSTALASVTGLSVPAGVNLRGVTVTGTGIPASTVITDIVGSTVYISKPATATNTGVSISMLDFPLPVGYEAEGVAAAGALKQEGATKDWTRAFDGFVERTVFGAAPGATAWVQTRARRAA